MKKTFSLAGMLVGVTLLAAIVGFMHWVYPAPVQCITAIVLAVYCVPLCQIGRQVFNLGHTNEPTWAETLRVIAFLAGVGMVACGFGIIDILGSSERHGLDDLMRFLFLLFGGGIVSAVAVLAAVGQFVIARRNLWHVFYLALLAAPYCVGIVLLVFFG
jgi:hypothetical protein